MNNRAQTSIHILVVVIVILGGLLYLFNQGGLGLVVTTIGLLIEAIVNWLGRIID